ncbi:hypothetical protein DTO013E5_1840 [Penicillium roqueforti]|uniref:Meiotically up-regulated protein Msb1/Mug8 domain-containing protein n=1 Tax=Penicillium roqueforti (strain FM164) TaxID=1365484 RepID=W6Q7F4_PENRF|nr:uncharacterized protein LCP9604111_204 [Penicillium roqueforti]CDM31926.1 Domain of unknown function DUF1708 [Penicillium roqueforti FM164]KAF9252678.1 hypothetical protein LCP9604111_204 [Penicillium roqueforti]KAI2675416.1 hypothetical protein CBS147355_6410 [Penicillium roqueforti]KAI2687031.1 hypothetical protein LCP963914a_3632 [Penicillium roqueforti]KAI2698375.1 hypothetical protein CBS147372_6905 [Penicillium roqueforti]
MSFLSRVFRGKDSTATKKQAKPTAALNTGPAKPKWTDAWQRTEVAPEEVQDLVRGCVHELKARALHTPFLLLPFRPSSDPSAARTFIRNYFNQSFEKGSPVNGNDLSQELRLTEPMVLCGVMKWCWSRLPGGVVTWEAYETFKMGENDSDMARDAFSTFIPIGGDSDARTSIILDFFDLLAAIAAHGKSNGLGGRKLSRYAGWWAFEHVDTGNGFEAAYKNWAVAADATSHLFFAYLRSLSPDVPRGVSGISSLPISLQSLVEATEYPPETPTLLQVTTTKVIMIVENVSPTPFSLLRRAKNFEYRDDDWHLQEFANYEDPVDALTDECLRVLRCISSTNQSSVSSAKQSTSLRDASWSRFEDIGFGGSIDSDPEDEANETASPATARGGSAAGLSSVPQSGTGDFGRPTTPSWADFMSSGFPDENKLKDHVGPLLLTPDKFLPPLASARGMSSQSHKRSLDIEPALEPAELASITSLDMDDSFWWVWISSLSGDEPSARKAVFGRCALLETKIRDTKWLILEEQIKGAAPEPEAGAQIVEKKRFFSFGSRRGKLNRRKSLAKKVPSIEDSYKRPNNQGTQSKTSIGPDQHKRIQEAAAALQKKHREQEAEAKENRAIPNDNRYSKTNSIMTLQPAIVSEASQAMKWTKNYDKGAFRAAYLNDNRAGTGEEPEDKPEDKPEPISKDTEEKSTAPLAPLPTSTSKSVPPPLPKEAAAAAVSTPLPPSPREAPTKAVNVATPEEKKPVAKPAVVEQPTERRESVDEGGKKLKKKTGNSGFKSMFSAKKKPEQQQPLVKTANSKEISTVAATRAALEAKAKAAQESGPMKKKPLPSTASVAKLQKPSPQRVQPTAKEPVANPSSPAQASASLEQNGEPPKTRRAIEYDALSRVATHELKAADQEFSKFDQGPLADQPAFVPGDSPITPVAQKSEVPQSPSNGNGVRHEVASSPESPEATHDRWKAIREAAAQRTAAQEEQVHDHDTEANTRTSQSERTDEGDTSGEETIEARVARIKARVAELTGNAEDGQKR